MTTERAGVFVLQSDPALGTLVVAWVALCFVGIVLGVVGSAFVRRLSNPVVKYRLLYLGVVFDGLRVRAHPRRS